MHKKEQNSSDQLVDGREGSTAGVEGVSAAGASASDTALSELSLREAACLGKPFFKTIYVMKKGPDAFLNITCVFLKMVLEDCHRTYP